MQDIADRTEVGVAANRGVLFEKEEEAVPSRLAKNQGPGVEQCVNSLACQRQSENVFRRLTEMANDRKHGVYG